jgi:biotin-(acetyl-CoA carboxylase) ligase
MSTPDETFRATMRGQTPDGEPATVIVTRQGLGRDGRAWLTFNGAIKTTVVLTDQEAEQLAGLLGDAARARRSQ